jgi:8-oxo-dGTP diphosphatase
MIKASQEINFKLGDFEFDFKNQEISAKQSFRFVAIKDLKEKHVTFPIDKHVVNLLKEKYL